MSAAEQSVFCIEPGTVGSPATTVLWAAPGSIDIAALTDAWTRRRYLGAKDISGPWAVACWDASTREHVLLTDPVGVQPLFWAKTQQGHIVAGSTLADLVDRPDVDGALDYTGILLDQGDRYLLGGPATQRTSFTAVAKIPAGHALRIRGDGSTRLDRYWDPESLGGPDPSLTLDDCAELLRDRIVAAVRRLTPSNVPVGAHVSGGLDCTSVATIAHAVLGENGGGLVAGYSWAPDEHIAPRFPGDERDLLDAVAAKAGFPVRTIRSRDSGEWFWRLDPLRYPNTDHQLECHVQEQARLDGIRVLLSGWGGDELASFNGRTVVAQMLRRGQVVQADRELTQIYALHTGRLPTVGQRTRRLASAAARTLPGSLRSAAQRNSSRTVDERALEILRALRQYSPEAAEIWQQNGQAFASVRGHHEMQLMLLQYGHIQRRIAGWHQTGQLMGIQYRYPLLDLGVVQAALRLPSWAFLRNGWTRPAFRLAMEPWLPSSVAWNTAKYEPSLYWPPAGGINVATLAKRRRHLEDAQYEAAMEMAMLTRDTREPRLPSHLRVTARPEKAVRAADAAGL